MNFGRCLYGTVQNKEKLLNTTLKSGKERKQDNEKKMENRKSGGYHSYLHIADNSGIYFLFPMPVADIGIFFKVGNHLFL